MDAKQISFLIDYVFHAHDVAANKLSKAVRKWDGKTPYGVHPTWCAMTILAETVLPEELRWSGAQALLLHDVLEDTTATLPDNTPNRVVELVQGMTFASSDEEMKLVWGRSSEIRLLKLYDKVSNLLDGTWMTAGKLTRYEIYTFTLCENVEHFYGQHLNITKMARAILQTM